MSTSATPDRAAGNYAPWNRNPSPTHHAVVRLQAETALEQLRAVEPPMLAYGRGRSYGDTCACPGGTLLDTSALRRVLQADWQTGTVRCEAGLTLHDLLALSVPSGWFPAVTPGTRHVSIGGAIAHDVHGKNHHRKGTFGRHVRRIALARSDGRYIECSPTENPELFAATVGGLGLTGLILWADLQLAAVPGPHIELEQFRVRHLEEAFDCASASADWEYTVSWIDALAPAHALGRGVHMRGRHAAAPAHRTPRAPRTVNLPFDLPGGIINRTTIGLHNTLRYRAARSARAPTYVHYEPFFYPLDSIGGWNRLYGRRGFFQHQSVIPVDAARAGVRELLRRVQHGRETPALVVLKDFGSVPSPGLLSFPRPGFTLAVDIPNRGARTHRLLQELDAVVRDTGGSIYPAKDARMTPSDFATFFPQWRQMLPWVDAGFRSGFWERVAGTERECSGS